MIDGGLLPSTAPGGGQERRSQNEEPELPLHCGHSNIGEVRAASLRHPGLILFLTAVTACQACPPEAQALLRAPDYSDPERAGRTFLAGLACDNAKVEYQALGESLKARYGATYDTYLLGRQDLRDEFGSKLRLAFRLEHLETLVSDAGPTVWWGYRGDRIVALHMVRQTYFEITTGDRKIGAYLDSLDSVVEVNGRRLQLDLEESGIRGVRIDEIQRVEVGREWKIGDYHFPEQD